MRRPLTPTPAEHVFLAHLTEAREQSGLTEEQLARRLRLMPQQVYRVELGQATLGFLDLRTWLIALGVPLNGFLARLQKELDELLGPTSPRTLARPHNLRYPDGTERPPIELEAIELYPPTEDEPDPYGGAFAILSPVRRRFLARLQQERLLRYLSLPSLARKVGLDFERLREFESGRWLMPGSSEDLQRLCDYLGVPWSEFLQMREAEDAWQLANNAKYAD